MAGNPTPDNQDELLALCEDLADGCHNHETAIGLNNNKEADIRAAITALRNAEAAFGAAKDDRQDAVDALQTADAAAVEFLTNARRALQTFLGSFWGAAWEPTGWPDQSTGVPATQEKRLNLCASLKIYFTNVPAHEVAPMGVTAAIAETRFQAISDARQLISEKEQAQTGAKQARDTALKNLRKRARDTIHELDHFLGDSDPLWHAFGLNMPSDPDTPEAVASVTLTPNLAGKVLVQWPGARRATRYRVFGKVLTVDAEFTSRATVTELSALLEGLPGGQTLQIYVVAANDAGVAGASPTAEVVIP
ncbi:MAG: fibronectin type III domain-containing protein [Verrucomicrobia bacterium]|nr:fibronectin type III domain-containing protein [Verrucomicrobiota bacterium]